MRRFFAVLLALVLACGCIAAFAESDSSAVDFTPNLAGALEKSATEWYSNGANRALLNVLLFDVNTVTDDLDITAVLTNSTYVGPADDLILAVCGYDGNKLILVTNMPVINKGGYYMPDTELSSALVDMLIEAALKENCDSFEKNSMDDIYACVEMISEALNS